MANHETPFPSSANSASSSDARPPTVLLVEDHPLNTQLLMRLLQRVGYPAESAENGETGFEMWKSGRFGLVMTDCNMPRMSGYDLARAIRDSEVSQNLPRTPIIGCTGNTEQEEVDRCLAAGMDDHVPKTVSEELLRKKLLLWLPV